MTTKALIATAQNEKALTDLYFSMIEFVEGNNGIFVSAEIRELQVTVVYEKAEVKPVTKKVNTVKQLQKEAKAYNAVEVFYDVYSDRLNFVGSDSQWLVDFFKRRNVIADRDRSGYSIDIKDAIALGFPTKANSYRLLTDARKAPVAC